jgi:hypothetical protein
MSKDYFYLGADPHDPEHLLLFDISERLVHMLVVGASGAGKSCLLTDLCGQDLLTGRGFTVLDAKGDLADDVLAVIATAPEETWPALARDVVIIDPSDPACTAAFNPLEVTNNELFARQTQDVMAALRRLWQIDDSQTARMVLILRRTVQLLMANRLTLIEAPRLLTDPAFRDGLIQACDDPELRRFWQMEFPGGKEGLQWAQSSLNRLESLLDDPNVRRFLGQNRSTFNFRNVMDTAKICIVSLSRGRLGHETADVLAGLLLVHIQLAAESRQRMSQSERRPHWLYCDEVQNIAGPTFEDFLAQARGFGLSVVLAHQNLSQLSPRLRDAIMSNARIKIAFKTSYDDSAILAREFWRITGERVKNRQLAWAKIGRLALPIGYDYQFHSVGDESRQNREGLQYLPPRHMAVHLAGEPAPYFAKTVDVPREELERARGRVARFKQVVAQVQRPKALPEPQSSGRLPEPDRPGTYEWAGRRPPSQRVRK